MVNGKVLHPIVGHGEMAWVGESIGRDDHRMVDIDRWDSQIYDQQSVSGELSLERTSAGFGPGFEGSVGVW